LSKVLSFVEARGKQNRRHESKRGTTREVDGEGKRGRERKGVKKSSRG
jgi:hypothetical protein